MRERVKQLCTKQSQMIVKCEAMAEAGATQASESNQPLANDASAKTIEFLRARLLSERAASKAARQQAQQIAEKVSELQARLDVEIEHRTKAEAAIRKVLRVLKTKGIAIDDVALASAETKTEIGMSTLDSIKEELENSEEVLCIEAHSTIDVDMPLRSSDHRDEGIRKDMTQHETPGSNDLGVGEGETETHFDVKNPAESHHGNRNASSYNGHGSDDPAVEECKTKTQLDVENSVGHHRNKQVEDVSEHGQDEVHLSVTSMPVLETHQSALECAANYEKELQTGQTTEHRLAIALKLKAMLHQIEKEVEALPKEQPLKLQLQCWVDHVVNMLEEGKEASLNGGLELHAIYDINTAETCSKIKSLMHTEGLAGKVNAEVIRLAETRYPSVNQMQPLVEEAARKVESDTNLSIFPKDKLHGKNLQRSKSVSTGYPSTMYSPTGIDALSHDTSQNRRQSSCESLKGGNRVAFDTFVCHPEMVQYSMSQAKTAHPSMFLNGHTRSDHTGAEWPHLVAAQSPRMSDEILKGEKAHRQWGEANPQTRVSGLERTGGLRPKEMLPSQSFMDGLVYDAPNDLYMKQNTTSARTAFVDNRNIEFERGHVHHPCQAYMGKDRDPMGFNLKGTMYPTLSLVDDKNGRLRDILTALHVARQHVNDEQVPYAEDQFVGTPTPNVADAEPYRGYHGDEMEHGAYDYHHDPWRSQAPIIQFPPSPSSEHGYTAFERHDGLRRSSSVSSNFMMPCVETHVQPRGEVQLGNGITLYID